jgi:hypothetical protein
MVSARSASGEVCDACRRGIETGPVLEVRLQSYDEAALPTDAQLCLSCFEDLTSGLGVPLTPASEFLVLVDPGSIGLDA